MLATRSSASVSMRFSTGTATPLDLGGFRLIIENMPNGSTAHEVLAVVFQVRQATEQVKGATRKGKPQLNVLLWQRARDPQRGSWSLPGGRLRNDEDMTTSVRRQLAE